MSLGLVLAATVRDADASGTAPLTVRITSPASGAPALGLVEVRVEVAPAGAARRVEIYLDTVRVAELLSPPWRATVDFGGEVASHRLEVLAYGVDRSGKAGGEPAGAVLQTGMLSSQLEIKVALQQLYVSLVGASERPLSREDFEVTDDGVPQSLVTFERGDVPFTAVLLLDASASMQGDPLTTALDGARSFVRALGPLDEAKLLLFSDRPRFETPFTRAAAILTLGLGDPRADGGTALNDALYLALSRLDSRQGRKVVVLLSDGIDIDSVLGMEEVRARARASGVRVEWLELEDPSLRGGTGLRSIWRTAEEHRRERDLLRRTVEESGGSVRRLGGVADVVPALAELLRELRGQYVLGYYPSATHGTGTWHAVEVRLRQPHRVRLRTQAGYAEPKGYRVLAATA